MASYYVSKTGSDSNNGTTWALAKLTSAGAISVSSETDTIYIGAGTWSEDFAYVRTFIGSGMFKTTIIPPSSSQPITAQIAISNLKLIFGTAVVGFGVFYYSSTILNNVYIDFNASTFYVSHSSSITANYCLFYLDLSTYGQGLVFNGTANTVINNCVMYIKTSTQSMTICNYSDKSQMRMSNSIVYVSSTTTFRPADNNSAWGLEQYNCWYGTNGIATATYLPNGAFSATDVLTNPLFVDPANGDFRLQSSSPCIGTGHA